MEGAIVQLKYDEEKLSASEKHTIKKEVDLEVRLLRTLQKLYEKYVPPTAREYTEGRGTYERRTGMRSQEQRNTANRADEGILETGKRTWSTENSQGSVRIDQTCDAR